jgi:energy-converting hydrogenase A subunit R
MNFIKASRGEQACPYFIAFDLEGPLSPNDNAYELMSLFPGGKEIFEIISRYDDLLALEGRQDYQPGDTLSLIVPFLLHHNISEADLNRLAQQASLVLGAKELIAWLHSRGWEVFCLTTTYEQYALTIAQRLGIPSGMVVATPFPLSDLREKLTGDELALVSEAEEKLLQFDQGDERAIKAYLDYFFWTELPTTELARVMKEVKPIGGERKVIALNGFAQKYHQPLSRFIVVGDSITDFKILEEVNQAGGLAVAFNANEYALPFATMGLASTHLSDLEVVLTAWEEGGREAVEEVVKTKESEGRSGLQTANFHWLVGKKRDELPLEIHHRLRRQLRQEAAELG